MVYPGPGEDMRECRQCGREFDYWHNYHGATVDGFVYCTPCFEAYEGIMDPFHRTPVPPRKETSVIQLRKYTLVSDSEDDGRTSKNTFKPLSHDSEEYRKWKEGDKR